MDLTHVEMVEHARTPSINISVNVQLAIVVSTAKKVN